jgi:hypothetical protein
MGSNRGGNAAEAGSEQVELKRKLAWRMGFAGMMIVILLGTLALFDRISAPEEPEPATVSSAPLAPVPKKDVTQPVKIAELPLEIGKEPPPPVAAEPESSASPIGKSSPFVEPPTRSPVLAAPVSPKMHADSGARPVVKSELRPDIKPVPPRVQSPSEPSKVPSPPPERPTAKPPSVPVLPPSTAAPTAAPTTVPTVAPPTATTQKLSPPAAAQPPAAPTEDYLAVARPPQPQPPRLFSGFSLQAGIFSDLRLAEELHAKLALNGIPSSFEARVNVGPFKKREEAIAAREKMKALGIDSVLVLPKGGKR